MPPLLRKIIQRTAGHGPLIDVLAPYGTKLPAAAIGGMAAGLLEGIGLGLLMPLLAILTGASLPTSAPAPLRAIADMVAQHDPLERAVMIGLLIVALIAAKGVIQVANESFLARTQGLLEVSVRNAVSAKLTRIDYRHLIEQEHGRILRIASTDPGSVAISCLEGARALVAAVTGLILAAALLTFDWRLFAVTALSVGAARLLLHRMQRRVSVIGKLYSSAEQQVIGQNLTLLRGMKAVRLFGRSERELEHQNRAAAHLLKTTVDIRRALAVAQPTMEVLFGLVFVAVIAIATTTGIPFAELSVFLILLYRIQPLLRSVSASWLLISSRRSAFAEIDWFLSLDDEMDHPDAETSTPEEWPDVVFKAVTFRYPNGTEALREVELRLPANENIALIGPSGSGKSTIVNLLCRFIAPTEGHICLGEMRIDDFTHAAWRGGIAVAGQDVELIDGTIAQNIAFARPSASSDEIVEVARLANADDFVRNLPRGYDTRVGPDGAALSGGQRQRIGIARALLVRPRILILDEATNALDPTAEAAIIQLLARHESYGTALVISHRAATLAQCSHAVVLQDGRVAQSGPIGDAEYFHRMQDHAGAPRADLPAVSDVDAR